MQKTIIGWTDYSWNAMFACSKVSDGCKHCYAETLALRYKQSLKPWTVPNEAENVLMKPHKLHEPYTIKEKHVRIFVNSTSDMFHRAVPDWYRAVMFCIMLDLPQHVFQILTKRSESLIDWHERFLTAVRSDDFRAFREQVKRKDVRAALDKAEGYATPWGENIWQGVSVEDARVLARIDHLRQSRAAVRFISAEPLIGAWGEVVDLTSIDWVIVGGESGVHLSDPAVREKRWLRMEWAREIRDLCVRQGTAYFFKQDSAIQTESRPYLVEEDGSKWRWNQYPGDLADPVNVETGEVRDAKSFLKSEAVRPSRPESPRRADLHEGQSVRVVNPERKPFNSIGTLEEIWELVTDPGHWIYNVRIEGLIYSYAAFDIEPDPPPSGTGMPPDPPDTTTRRRVSLDEAAKIARAIAGELAEREEKAREREAADSPSDTFAPFIPALSIYEPWASMISLSLKRIETRAFPVTYRGDIVIHASKRWTRDEQNAAVMLIHQFPEIAAHASVLNNPPLGCALAVARLVDCVPSEKLRETISAQERACGNYVDGRYGFILEDVRVFPTPIPMIGQQTTRALGWRIPHPLYHIEAPKPDAPITVTTMPVAPLTKFQLVRPLFDPETQTWRGDQVYIGRAMPSYRLPESVWANPFKIERDTPEARRAAIEQYRAHITGKIAADPVRYDLSTLQGKTLVCWCTPDGSRGEHDERLCHGHVLLELLKEREQPIPVKPLPPAPPPKDEIASLYQPFDAKQYQKHVTADTLAIDRAHHLIAEHYKREDRGSAEWQTELERLRRLRDAVIAWARAKASAPKPKQRPEDKLREELAKARHGIEVLSPHADPPPGSKLRRSQLAAEMLGGKRKEEDRLLVELEKLARADAKVLA